MKPEKKEALSAFHRTNIVQAAEQLFTEQGVAAATVDDIARRADYSKSTVYVYFSGKEEIYGCILLRGMELLLERIGQALAASEDWQERYFKVCASLCDFRSEHPLYFDGLLGDINADIENPKTPAVFRTIYDTGERINALIGGFLREGMACGIVRSDIRVPETVFFFWTGISGVIRAAYKKQVYIENRMKTSLAEFLQHEFTLFLNAIAVEREDTTHE